MANKLPKPEEIVSKLQQIEVLMEQDISHRDGPDRTELLNKPIAVCTSSRAK